MGKVTPMKLCALVGHNTGSVCTGEELLSVTVQIKQSDYRYTVDTPSKMAILQLRLCAL